LALEIHQVQVARSQAAKILKRKPGTGATEEIPLTVFNIIEALVLQQGRWEELHLEGMPKRKLVLYSNHSFSEAFVVNFRDGMFQN